MLSKVTSTQPARRDAQEGWTVQTGRTWKEFRIGLGSKQRLSSVVRRGLGVGVGVGEKPWKLDFIVREVCGEA